jgi:hypothetical protein
VKPSKIAHGDAGSSRLILEAAPDNEARHARTKLRFLRKRPRLTES